MIGKPRKLGNLTYRGSLPATDPIYQGGWNFIAGKNLNSRYVEKSIGKAREQEQPEQDKPEG